MQFPRSSQLDDRRRRVLTEEVIGGAGPEPGEPAGDSPVKPSARRRRPAAAVRPYGDTALLEKQPRITDLIPQHYGVLALWFLAGVTVVAGLESLYAFLPELASMTADGTLAAFDLEAEGSLAGWFSCSTLSLASAVAVVVYSIRRHKADDYHGRYRIWLWAALCWLVMSMDEGGSLHEAFQELMSYVTGQRGYGDGSIWWIGVYAFALGAVGTRLTLEMRDCRSSTASLLIAAGCYAAAVGARLNLILPDAGSLRVMVEEGAEMSGNLFLLFAMTLHARYVILDAQGLLPAKKEKPARPPKAAKPEKPKAEKAEKRAEAETKPAAAETAPARSWFRKAKIDPAHASPPAPKHQPAKSAPPLAAAVKAASRRVVAETEYEDDDAPRHARKHHHENRQHDNRRDEADDDRGNRRLSKAERKAQRREQSRSRHEDEEA